MAYSQPARRRTRRIRIRRIRVAGLLLVIAAIAVSLGSKSPASSPSTASWTSPHPRGDKDRTSLSTNGWPLRGQGAYVLDNGRPLVSPHQQPVPIASVAKVMTAYVVLKHYPLQAGDSGRQFVVSPDDAEDTEVRRHDGQSVVAVRAGEQLTERDALMAILLPSANNISLVVARQVSGSVASFVAEMNSTARALGMTHTTYTDPSGYDDGTVSTALDQLRLAQVVAGNETLAAMMATRTYWLPVAGEVKNTNALLGHDGFVGMKTGSDKAAGGCLMFRAVWPTASGSRSLIGVVLGQQGDNVLTAGLYAAKQLADRLGAGQAGLAPPAATYRPHIENPIRVGNAPAP